MLLLTMTMTMLVACPTTRFHICGAAMGHDTGSLRISRISRIEAHICTLAPACSATLARQHQQKDLEKYIKVQHQGKCTKSTSVINPYPDGLSFRK
jgi:hypothetical protein